MFPLTLSLSKGEPVAPTTVRASTGSARAVSQFLKTVLIAGLALLGSLTSVRAEYTDPSTPEVSTPTATFISSPTAAAPSLIVVHPVEGTAFPWLKSSFVYGWAEPGGTLTVDGKPVDLFTGGGWLTMVDYVPGPNTIHFVYEKNGSSVTVVRSVTVGGGGGPLTGMEGIYPEKDLGVVPGETVAVSFHGPPGGRAWFRVRGAGGKFPMSEVNGVYRGFFVPPPKLLLKDALIDFRFKNQSGRASKKKAPGHLTVLDPQDPWVVEVSTDLAVLTAGPGFSVKDLAGYVMFPPPGVRLRVTGFEGDELRVRLTKDRELWIARNEVRRLPPGTLPPQAVTAGVSVLPDGRDGLVKVTMSQKAPFEVTVSEDLRRLDVFFYGAYSNTDWVHLHEDVPWIRQVRWSQDSTEVFHLSVDTDENSWWGYDARYEGNNFVLQLRRPPPMMNPKFPLQGLTIVVDAGHSPDTGAVGITGTLERDLNLSIAKRLKEKLEADKATVVMMRKGEEPVALYDRPRLAWAAKADLLVSIHNNALGEGENPLEKHGYGVYYFHPMSLPLAREIHEAYGDVFGKGRNALKVVEKDDGLHWGNLALPRTSQMPAVLTESAYMIYPPEEWWLRQPEFQGDCAEAIREGVKRYVRTVRPAK